MNISIFCGTKICLGVEIQQAHKRYTEHGTELKTLFWALDGFCHDFTITNNKLRQKGTADWDLFIFETTGKKNRIVCNWCCKCHIHQWTCNWGAGHSSVLLSSVRDVFESSVSMVTKQKLCLLLVQRSFRNALLHPHQCFFIFTSIYIAYGSLPLFKK